jgi:hypothetical protein
MKNKNPLYWIKQINGCVCLCRELEEKKKPTFVEPNQKNYRADQTNSNLFTKSAHI